jgi:hypothetical protein
MKSFLFAFLAVFVFAANGFAITWVPKDFACPIDGEKNTFLVVGSYGSYVYNYPSKYQGLFFPQTDSPTFYICKRCHLATYMWDFDKIPTSKLPELKQLLAGIKVSRLFAKYTELPVSERLEIMEKVYAVLGKDGDWWENFYRVKGYHYGREGLAAKATDARRRSLELIAKDIENPKNAAPKKLLYYLSGAMKHFIGDDQGAVLDLATAQKMRYENKAENPEENRGAEAVLNERIADYIARIKSEKEKPRLFDRAYASEH